MPVRNSPSLPPTRYHLSILGRMRSVRLNRPHLTCSASSLKAAHEVPCNLGQCMARLSRGWSAVPSPTCLTSCHAQCPAPISHPVPGCRQVQREEEELLWTAPLGPSFAGCSPSVDSPHPVTTSVTAPAAGSSLPRRIIILCQCRGGAEQASPALGIVVRFDAPQLPHNEPVTWGLLCPTPVHWHRQGPRDVPSEFHVRKGSITVGCGHNLEGARSIGDDHCAVSIPFRTRGPCRGPWCVRQNRSRC